MINANDPHNNDLVTDINNLSSYEFDDLFDIFGEEEEKNETTHNKKNCKKCDTDMYLFNDLPTGNCVCSNCGNVFSEIVDSSAGWKCFDDENKSDSVGGNGITYNELLPQSSLSTTISGGSNRLKTLQNWSIMPYRERSLNAVYKMIKNICEKNKIIKCVETDAQIMYKTLSDCKHVKGKNKNKYIIIRGSNRISLIAACIFYACRRKGITRSPKEVSEMFNTKHIKMTNGCKMFIKLSNIKKISMSEGISLAEHFIKRFCDDLKIEEQFILQTIKIAKNIKKLNIASTHIPYSIAVGSILLMASINNIQQLDKKFIANKFKVSGVTIDKTLNKIKPYERILINDELTIKLLDVVQQKEKQIKIPQKILDKRKQFNIYVDDVHDENVVNDSDDVLHDNVNEQSEFEICEEYLLDENYDANDLELCDDDEYFENLRCALAHYEIKSVGDIDEYLDIVNQLNDDLDCSINEINISQSINIMNKLINKNDNKNKNSKHIASHDVFA
jgi:transcription initiation factor TFIIIB Brf1 subunit/transcription initiation factor TFIIB